MQIEAGKPKVDEAAIILSYQLEFSKKQMPPYCLQKQPMLSTHHGLLKQQLPKKNLGCPLQQKQLRVNIREREKYVLNYKTYLHTVDKALGNKLAFSINILNFLRSYVLSLCQLKNVLLSVTANKCSHQNAKACIPKCNHQVPINDIMRIEFSFSEVSYSSQRSKSIQASVITTI